MSSIFTGRLLLVVGPSGVGKGTTLSFLKKRHLDWIFPVSATTRSPRPGEIEGETYHFFSMEEFNEKIENADFIEWAWVHGKQKYGMLKSEIFPFLEKGDLVIREVDIQGFLDAREIVPAENLTSIFLLPPPREVLIQRIMARAPISNEELEERLKSMEHEMESGKECDFQIQTIDGNVGHPAEEIERIVSELIRKGAWEKEEDYV